MDYFFTYNFTSTRIPQKSSNYFIFPSESNWFEVLCSVVIRYLQICRLILQIIFELKEISVVGTAKGISCFSLILRHQIASKISVSRVRCAISNIYPLYPQNKRGLLPAIWICISVCFRFLTRWIVQTET